MAIFRYDLSKPNTPRTVISRHLTHARDELKQRFDLDGEALEITLRDTIRDVLAKADP